MRISDWSSDVCSSDLHLAGIAGAADQDQLFGEVHRDHRIAAAAVALRVGLEAGQVDDGEFRHEACKLGLFGPHQQRADEMGMPGVFGRSEEHTSELQSLMRISYAVFCLKKQNTHYTD